MSNREKAATELRAKVIEILMSAEHAPMDTHDPRDGSCLQCPWPVYQLGPDAIADALIAAGVISEAKETGDETEFPWKSDRGLISSALRTDVTPNYHPARDSDERPPICETCGAPFVWCKCADATNAREALERDLADAGLPVDQIMALVDAHPAVALVAKETGDDSSIAYDDLIDNMDDLSGSKLILDTGHVWVSTHEQVLDWIRGLKAGAVALAVPETNDEKTLLDPPWLCVGGDNCGDRFATMGDAHAPHSAAYRPIIHCTQCGTPIHFYESPTGSWWSHVVHPRDEHDAEPRIDRERAFRIMNAILDENEYPARPEAGTN